jgi:hypothetical protein
MPTLRNTLFNLHKQLDMNNNPNILNRSYCKELVSRHPSGAIYFSDARKFLETSYNPVLHVTVSAS